MSALPRAEAPKFFVPLESLRGLAALIVVVYHAVWTNPVTALNFFQNGALMVDFFFVLSGFVIFHSYGRKLGGWADIGRFLWLRVGRLYPLHLAFLLVFLGFEVLKLVAERHAGIVADKPAFTVNNGYALLTNLLLIHSLGLHHSLTFNYPSWSISTEFYAYVLFAAVRSLFSTIRHFIIAAVSIIASGTGVLLWLHIVPLVDAGFDYGFFRCCAGFFLGTLVYCLYARVCAKRETAGDSTQKWRRYSWLSVASLGLTVLVLAFINPTGWATYALPPLSALIILTIVLWPMPLLQSALSSRPLAWLGRVSYSLYMVHAAVVWVVTQFLTVIFKFPKIELADGHGVATPATVGFAVLVGYIIGVLVLSHFTYHWIEEPFRKRSRQAAERWFPSGAGALVASPAVRN